jgi:haloalkane dehalogenase
MTAYENQPTNDARGRRVRGVRYGEVLLVTGGPGGLEASVYNTLGLNDCPNDLWQALDADAIAKQ